MIARADNRLVVGALRSAVGGGECERTDYSLTLAATRTRLRNAATANTLFAIGAALLVCTGSANAQAPLLRVTASLSTNNVLIGDVATLKVHVDHPAGAQPQLPEFNREKRVVARDQKATPAKTGGTDFEVTLTSFTPGSHLVSTGLVTATLSNNTIISSPFPGLTLRVQSAIADTNQALVGLKGPVSWKRPLPWMLAWIIPAALLLIALIAWLVVYLMKRADAPRPLPPPTPPHEKALLALQALRMKQWIEQLNIEPFYVELSGIARRYIEERFNLRAPEQTTEEFIRATVASPVLSTEHRQLTASFLEQCDLVKFARHQPGMEDMRAAFWAAEKLVKETVPPPPPPPGAKP